MPVVFGVEESTLRTIKGAIEAVSALARHPIADADPELGANLMIFFLQDWGELLGVRDLDRLVPELRDLLPRLAAEGANQYRVFRFDRDGAIRACFVFVRMDAELAEVPAELLSLSLAVHAALLWSDRAFTDRAAFVRAEDGASILKAEIAGVIRAAYDPVMPAVARDMSHAMRIHARLLRVS